MFLMVREGKGKRGMFTVFCSHFISALPKQRPSNIFSNVTPACQVLSENRTQIPELFSFFFCMNKHSGNFKKKKKEKRKKKSCHDLLL